MVVVLFLSGYWLAGGHAPLLATIGFLFVAIPYHLLATGARTLERITPQATSRQRWLCVALFNAAFLVLFAAFAGPAVIVWLSAMLLVAALCHVSFCRYPFLDILAEGFIAASPFVLGVLITASDRTAQLLPIGVILLLWSIASHIIWQLAEHSEQATIRLTSFVSRVGNEIAIMCVLGLYAVSAVLPLVYYGRRGVFATLVFVLYLMRTAPLLTVRFHARNMVYVRTWWLVRRLNYLTLVVVLLYVLTQST